MAATATANTPGHVCYPAAMVYMHYRGDDVALKIGLGTEAITKQL